MTYAENSWCHHYVSIQRGRQRGLLVGPFRTRHDAEPWVEPARSAAIDIDPDCWFDSFGTSRLVTRWAPPGRLNQRLGIPPGGVPYCVLGHGPMVQFDPAEPEWAWPGRHWRCPHRPAGQPCRVAVTVALLTHPTHHAKGEPRQ